MSGDVRLSEKLGHIKLLVQQTPMIVKRDHVTATCCQCEMLRQRCMELEHRVIVLQSAVSSISLTPREDPDKRLADKHFVGVVSDDMLVSSIQESTKSGVDSMSSHSGCSSSFSMVNIDMDHEGDEVSEMLLQSDVRIQPSKSYGQSENDHLCDQPCTSRTSRRLAEQDHLEALKLQLAATNEDYREVCAEKNKLQHNVEKLLRDLETSKAENEHASQLWRKFEREVLCLRDENQELRDTVRKMKMEKNDSVMVVPATTPKIGEVSATPVRNENDRVPGGGKTRQHTLVCDLRAAGWTCSTCKHTVSWKHNYCQQCGCLNK